MGTCAVPILQGHCTGKPSGCQSPNRRFSTGFFGKIDYCSLKSESMDLAEGRVVSISPAVSAAAADRESILFRHTRRRNGAKIKRGTHRMYVQWKYWTCVMQLSPQVKPGACSAAQIECNFRLCKRTLPARRVWTDLASGTLHFRLCFKDTRHYLRLKAM